MYPKNGEIIIKKKAREEQLTDKGYQHDVGGICGSNDSQSLSWLPWLSSTFSLRSHLFFFCSDLFG